MPQQVYPHANIKFKKPVNVKTAYPVLAVIMAVLLFVIYYGFNLGNQVITRQTPWANAAMEIKLEATMAHLWLEERISGDLSIGYDIIQEHVENSIWHATALLKGGGNTKDKFLPLDNPFLRQQIQKVHNKLTIFKKITQQRWDNMATAGAGSDLDQKYDRIFKDVIIIADQVESAVRQEKSHDLIRFSFTRNILFAVCFILSFILMIIFFFIEKRTIADFTKIQEAKHLAEAKEQWLRVTMRSMGDALITTDTTAKVTYLNPVASSLTGWTSEEAIGQDVYKIFNIISERTRQPAKNPIYEVLKKQYIVGLANHTALISKNGKEYPIADSGAPIIDPDGNCIGAVLVFHDISERVEVENKLRMAKKEWERSFNAIHDLITIHDKNMIVTKANTATCSFFKIKEQDLVGRHCYEIFRGEDTPCPGCPIIKGQKDLSFHEIIIEHKQMGKTFQVSCARTLDKKYKTESIVHSAKDITEKVRLEEDLFQARKMEAIGTLAGGIAHDFNNILSAIMGYTELALAKTQKDKTLSRYLMQVTKASHRAKELVHQILTFSRKGADDQTALLNPHFIINESLKLIRASLPTSIQIQMDIDPSCGTIVADPTKIQQVLVNLCTNAAHALPNEIGLLKVALKKCQLTKQDIAGEENILPGPFIHLSICDTGTGIDKVTLEHIFEPYFTTKKQGKGTGLGLAMVHGIVQDYNGMIKVESEYGKGSTFHIYFPAADKPVILEEKEQEPIPGGHERILVVDDEDEIVNLHKESLQRLGYTITGATGGIEALETFQASPENFDLVITDQTMPKMLGMDLAKKLLKIRPDLPIILNTGYSSMVSEEKAKEEGIKEFVIKPVDRHTLATLVRKVLDEA